ncbi:MAG TPA: enoyl-CoA hydratase-related protein [Gammaproteobacteria bacterium]|nr:enoyl-CoA hydratase-related protein [Gammaproteobacteria bacterium]
MSVHTSTDGRGIATVTLDRPEVHNAFDDRLIADLTALLERLDGDERVRAVVLTGAGKSFSAGADMRWMRDMAAFGRKENIADALRLARMLDLLNRLSRPTIARVNGHAFGGGVGLIACCDIVVASTAARFALTEVRLGVLPAVISPYVIAAIGARQARRWFLTAGRMDAAAAERIGLVHRAVEPDGLDAAVEEEIGALLAAGPEALAACKTLIETVVDPRERGAGLMQRTAEMIAERRASAEGQEGLSAFLEKRNPAWRDR